MGGAAKAELRHIKPLVDPSTLLHRQLLDGHFWTGIPAYRDISPATPPRGHDKLRLNAAP